MRNFKQLLSGLIIFVFVGCSNSNQYYEETVKADELILNVLNANHLPGISVTILKEGNMVYSKGFGYADIEEKRKISPSNTRFRIGSFSKTLATSALMKLVEDNKINLDSSIYFYVPDYPKKRWDFTPRQIAGHLSGMRHYRGDEMMINKNFLNVEDALSIFKTDSLLHEPETKYKYSTHSWTLLSLIIENASGESFLDFMQANVFDLLDMKKTHPEKIDLTGVEKVSYYYLDSTKTAVLAPEVNNSWKWAGGGFISTTEDVAKFLWKHSSYDYLTEKSISEMTTPQKTKDGKTTNYGLGWRTRYDKNKNVLIGHTGGSIGGTTYAFMAPHSNTIVVMTTNLSSASVSQFEKTSFGSLSNDLFELFE